MSASPEVTTVVLADDQALMRSGLRMLLERSDLNPRVVGWGCRRLPSSKALTDAEGRC